MAWRVLKLELPDVPHVLVKSRFDSSGHQLELTDLSRIWRASASKDEIIRRALDVGSSIDPSEDDEQFNILLGKIESALDCAAGTSLIITSENDENGSNLQLNLSAPLPRPLPPFKWTLQLQRQTDQIVGSELVTPLIQQANTLRHQIQQLVDELHDKDRIISKICDRLETSGNDLTTVFPGVSNVKTSRKKGQREQLAKYVKGLDDFDERAWRDQGSTTIDGGTLDANHIDEVFRDLPSGLQRNEYPSSSDWWKHLGRGSYVRAASVGPEQRVTSGSLENGRNDVQPPSNTDADDAQEEEFQRQSTPLHMKPKPSNNGKDAFDSPVEYSGVGEEHQNQTSMHSRDDSTTDEGDDLDAVPRKRTRQKAHSPSEEKQASPGPKKLGALGGPTAYAAASEANESPNKETNPPKTRSKIGTIGGKAKAYVPETEAVDHIKSSQTSPPAKTSRMGVIGGKRATKSASPPPAAVNEEPPEPVQDPSPRRPRSTTKEKEKTPRPREPSEDRADKKRDQLKRELEEKAKAPVKKKRKF